MCSGGGHLKRAPCLGHASPSRPLNLPYRAYPAYQGYVNSPCLALLALAPALDGPVHGVESAAGSGVQALVCGLRRSQFSSATLEKGRSMGVLLLQRCSVGRLHLHLHIPMEGHENGTSVSASSPLERVAESIFD